MLAVWAVPVCGGGLVLVPRGFWQRGYEKTLTRGGRPARAAREGDGPRTGGDAAGPGVAGPPESACVAVCLIATVGIPNAVRVGRPCPPLPAPPLALSLPRRLPGAGRSLYARTVAVGQRRAAPRCAGPEVDARAGAGPGGGHCSTLLSGSAFRSPRGVARVRAHTGNTPAGNRHAAGCFLCRSTHRLPPSNYVLDPTLSHDPRTT